MKHLVKGDPSYTEELMELLAEEEASMAAGGKGAASKKGKDKGGSKSAKGSATSGGIDEEAMKVQAQMARREKLQGVTRLPAVVSAAEATLLTADLRGKRDAARQKVIAGFDATQAARVRARQVAKTQRAEAQVLTVEGYKNWRANSNMQRWGYYITNCALTSIASIALLTLLSFALHSLQGAELVDSRGVPTGDGSRGCRGCSC
jgi:hypothetical protein